MTDHTSNSVNLDGMIIMAWLHHFRGYLLD